MDGLYDLPVEILDEKLQVRMEGETGLVRPAKEDHV